MILHWTLSANVTTRAATAALVVTTTPAERVHRKRRALRIPINGTELAMKKHTPTFSPTLRWRMYTDRQIVQALQPLREINNN